MYIFDYLASHLLYFTYLPNHVRTMHQPDPSLAPSPPLQPSSPNPEITELYIQKLRDSARPVLSKTHGNQDSPPPFSLSFLLFLHPSMPPSMPPSIHPN